MCWTKRPCPARLPSGCQTAACHAMHGLGAIAMATTSTRCSCGARHRQIHRLRTLHNVGKSSRDTIAPDQEEGVEVGRRRGGFEGGEVGGDARKLARLRHIRSWYKTKSDLNQEAMAGG